MIGIIDYGAGNLQSVINAFEKLNLSARLVRNAQELAKFERIILPGVGAFGEAMKKLKSANLDEAIKDFVASGRPFLGICLGMQLLFEKSSEFGEHAGLGLLRGEVVKFDDAKFDEPLKVPHTGWNVINFVRETPINRGLKKSEYLYFVHSYHVVCDENAVLGSSEYGYKFTSAVAKGNVFGFQPHPEKSHDTGLKILQNFGRL
ncbi:imidazole glycerol phosphate synthase subunit HisH [Campylobacter curvus]|uniref:imidazole glycerol phosphate synthase subunit HisH n=1 Tax=Campylobacter curvus TaxID=200 RepID=UPI00035CBC13|nr:imidazole glycerol phosphate synthase subunit HisH [Campylobacter curvus]QKF60731.1 imidazole glycerol phosphate synthase HisFH, HisH subunit [Campylobacter curvus]UEB49056.1 imidazole glycerol phosphate synthase subunit HisH [Campylobacter curvus]